MLSHEIRSLAEKTEALETELVQKKFALAQAEKKIKRLTDGNVVLVRRDGFVAYRYIEPMPDFGSVTYSRRLPYDYREYRPDPRIDSSPYPTYTLAYCRTEASEIRFRNTNRTDEAGRTIFEEV